MRYDIGRVLEIPNHVIRCKTRYEAEMLLQILRTKYRNTKGYPHLIMDYWDKYGDRSCYNLNQYTRRPFPQRNRQLTITFANYEYYLREGYTVVDMQSLAVDSDDSDIVESSEPLELLFA